MHQFWYGLLGYLQVPLWVDGLVLLIMTQITIAAVTIFLHRSQSHRSLSLHPVISHFFRFWLWCTTGMVTKEWVAIHRKHHDVCETKDDPHSPQIYGVGTVFFKGTELYRKASTDQEMLERYGRGTPDDWMERNVYSRFSVLGIILMLFTNLFFFGLWGISMWAVQMMWIPISAAGIINGIGHYWGYRNYEVKDASRNIIPWALFIGGEELHNNHHTFPSSAKMSSKWWELDIGWFYIKTLRFLKLATVHRLPPKLARVPGKNTLDADTLYALISNRFQIMSRYRKEVIRPVFKAERARAGEAGRALYRRTKRLLSRETSLINPKSEQRLNSLLDRNQQLALVYQYRLRLQEIWNRTTSNPKELLEALQEWCHQAEATGLKALHDFAMKLKSYAPAPAAS